MTVRLVPLDDSHHLVDWSDLSSMKVVRCGNHPTSRYLTKNPWTRGLHFVEPAEGMGISECPCPFSDLAVEVEEEEPCDEHETYDPACMSCVHGLDSLDGPR